MCIVHAAMCRRRLKQTSTQLFGANLRINSNLLYYIQPSFAFHGKLLATTLQCWTLQIPVKMGGPSRHFLLLPYPGFGHITPLLELARKIVASGHHATLGVSDNLLTDMRTRNMISPGEDNIIHFIGLKDGVYHPSDNTLDPKMFQAFNKMTDMSFEDFLGKIPTKNQPTVTGEFENVRVVDVVVVDLTHGDLPFRICRQRNIPVVAFAPFAGFMAVRMLQITEDTPVLSDEDFVKDMNSDAVVGLWKDQLLKSQQGLLLADMFLINSFKALEPTFSTDLVRLCPKFAHVKCGFVGPLFPPLSEANAKEHSETDRVVGWLNRQKERSVVYFSFGTAAVANPRQIEEICKALIESKRPFIWSVRPAQQQYLPVEIQASIKKQFENPHVTYLILGWAPQKLILQHKSVRVFVSHCGWNSTMEGLSNGISVVAWPMFGDQHGDADLVVSSGCGLKIPQVDMSGQRIVEQAEILDHIGKVAQWEMPLIENSHFLAAQKMKEDAQNAVGNGGDSAQTFASLLALGTNQN